MHQDLKPANVLVDVLGNYKITDFSLASVVAANRTHGLATVRYAAPELLTAEYGKVGPATDLYALGHIAYELALGTRQHVKQFPAVFEGNSSKEPPPNKWMMWHASINTKAPTVEEVKKEFPSGLSEIIARLMGMALGQRFAWAGEMLEDLGRVREEMNVPVVVASRAAAVVAAPAPVTAPRGGGTGGESCTGVGWSRWRR